MCLGSQSVYNCGRGNFVKDSIKSCILFLLGNNFLFFLDQINKYILYCDLLLIIWLFETPMDCSLPGSSVRGILQARIVDWVASPFSWRSSQSRDWTQVSCIADRFLLFEPPGKPTNIFYSMIYYYCTHTYTHIERKSFQKKYFLPSLFVMHSIIFYYIQLYYILLCSLFVAITQFISEHPSGMQTIVWKALA